MKISKTILLVIFSGLLLLFLTFSCKKDPPKVAPTLSTATATDITSTSVTTGGSVSNDGNTPITSRGACWSTNENPTLRDTKTTNGKGIGSFTSSITNLLPGTTYYIRAYATNAIGTGYGNQLVITSTSVLAAVTTTQIS